VVPRSLVFTFQELLISSKKTLAALQALAKEEEWRSFSGDVPEISEEIFGGVIWRWKIHPDH
jgi:hypothetical protein